MDTSTSRRNFLKTAITLPAAIAVGAPILSASADSAATTAPASMPLPTRTLGRGGRNVTMVALGGDIAAYSPDYLDIAWSMGIRYFDNAEHYSNGQSERLLGAFLAKHPERRKELFIVSKDHPAPGPAADAPDDRYPPRHHRHRLSRPLFHPWHRPPRVWPGFAQLAEERRLQKSGRSAQELRQGQDGRLLLP